MLKNMNENDHNKFGGIGKLALVAFAVAALVYAFSYERSTHPYSSFSVSGEGKVTAIPDIAEINAIVLTEGGTDLSALQKQNTDKGNAVVDFLKEQGVEAKDIKTQNYSIQPRYRYSTCSYEYSRVCPPPEIVGYSISQNIAIKMRDLSTVGDILKGVVDAGANTVSGPSFTIDDPNELKAEARAKAVADARKKAEAVAKAGGFKLGKIQYIGEVGAEPYYYGKAAGMGGDAIATLEAAPPTIEPGSQEIVVNIAITYEIK